MIKGQFPSVGVNQKVLEFILKRKFGYKFVKYVEVLLIFWPGDDSWFLQQVIVKVSVFNFVILCRDRDGQVLAETGWVIVSNSLTVAKSLQNWIAYFNRFLNLLFFFQGLIVMNLWFESLVVIVDESETLLIGFGLASAWLSRNHHGLWPTSYQKIPQHFSSDWVNMGLILQNITNSTSRIEPWFITMLLK